MQKLILFAALCLGLTVHAQNCGTNVIYFNDAYSLDEGLTWTNLFEGELKKTELVTSTNLNRFYRAQHVVITNTATVQIISVSVYYGDSPSTIYSSNVMGPFGKILSRSFADSAAFKPWITITNIPLPMPPDCDCVLTNYPLPPIPP
jgi:hypothetical protein